MSGARFQAIVIEELKNSSARFRIVNIVGRATVPPDLEFRDGLLLVDTVADPTIEIRVHTLEVE